LEGKYKPECKCVIERFKRYRKIYDPKRRCRWKRAMGAKLELDVVGEALRRMGLLHQFMYCPNGRVDWIWVREGWELECKNLEKEKYVPIAWLYDEVVSRFSENAKRKVLVITKDCWSPVADVFLEKHGIDVIVVGSISRRRFYERAIRRFEEGFLDLVRKAAAEKVVIYGRD